ncbi:MAG TPA: SCE4755 family polysaccharide monooxygenase-like protein [Kofleriaceae bacterium]|nr:SCE4755 family polysaccharide monooxygenase-like protein [Kofleriaceae bacterium]
MKLAALVLTLPLVLGSAGLADAHLRLLSPSARYGDSQKAGPCGVAGGVRTTDKVSTFAPGETITLVWDEFIDHPGHFRISFDDDGDDSFVDPATADELDSAPSVLEDGIADQIGGTYNYQITLPDLECDNCTLQVIQVMTDKPPYGDGNDIYYQCVDLILTNTPLDPAPDPNDPNDPGDPGDPTDPSPSQLVGGCSAASASGGGPVVLLGVLLLGIRGRRRSR